MKFIDPKSHIVSQIFTKRLEQIQSGKKKLQWLDSKFEDFDGTSYHIHSVEGDKAKGTLQLSVNLPYFEDLEKCKATDHLTKVYGDYTTEKELDYNFSVKVDLNELEEKEAPAVIDNLALIKRNAFAAFCNEFMDKSLAGKEAKPKVCNITETDQLWLTASEDRITAYFALNVESDEILVNMFLKEMEDTRKKPDMSNTPSVTLLMNKKPDVLPKKCKHKGPFLILGLFHKHFKTDEDRHRAIDLLCCFHPYVNYHIKCNKAHIHSRMRKKLAELLKVMNRSKFSESGSGGGAKKKKAASGKKGGKKAGAKKTPPKKKKSAKKGKGGPPPPPGGKTKKKKSGKKKA